MLKNNFDKLTGFDLHIAGWYTVSIACSQYLVTFCCCLSRFFVVFALPVFIHYLNVSFRELINSVGGES